MRRETEGLAKGVGSASIPVSDMPVSSPPRFSQHLAISKKTSEVQITGVVDRSRGLENPIFQTLSRKMELEEQSQWSVQSKEVQRVHTEILEKVIQDLRRMKPSELAALAKYFQVRAEIS